MANGIYLHYFHTTKFAENYIYYVEIIELDEDYKYVKKIRYGYYLAL